jgi:hypothetical protein
MKRLLVLVAVLVPLSLFSAGCGGSAGDAAKGQKAGVPPADQQKQMMESMMKNKADMSKAAAK